MASIATKHCIGQRLALGGEVLTIMKYTSSHNNHIHKYSHPPFILKCPRNQGVQNRILSWNGGAFEGIDAQPLAIEHLKIIIF